MPDEKKVTFHYFYIFSSNMPKSQRIFFSKTALILVESVHFEVEKTLYNFSFDQSQTVNFYFIFFPFDKGDNTLVGAR